MAKDTKLEQAKEAIESLLQEFATELDLHYEDADFFALTPSINVMKSANEALIALGGQTPDSVKHVISRYNKTRN